MAKKRKRLSSTERMLEAVEKCDACLCKNFPPEFLIGLRGALDAGLTCEQITAFFVLATGWYKACGRMDGESLIQRAWMLSKVMVGDIEEEAGKRMIREKATSSVRASVRWKKKVSHSKGAERCQS